MQAQPINSTWVWQEASRVLEGPEKFARLEAVVREQGRLVFRVAYGVLRNAHDAEDVVQEVFLRVHRSGTEGVADVPAWLARIAYRLALDRLRQPRAADLAEIEVASSSPDAEHTAIQRQRVEQVHRLVAALPEELRHPLVLSTMEELNSRQIAEVLGIPESSVRGRIFRARQILKEKLSALTEKRR